MGGAWLFESSVGMKGEASPIPFVNRSIGRPWPASKTSSLVIVKGLTQAGVIVHHEGSLLGYRFSDRTTLKNQAVGTTYRMEGCRKRGLQH